MRPWRRSSARSSGIWLLVEASAEMEPSTSWPVRALHADRCLMAVA
jgi:hypothetical protein